MSLKSNGQAVECPRCRQGMNPEFVKIAVWSQDRLYVIEDIPAQVCGSCREQVYDNDTADVIQRLTEEGFSFAAAHLEIMVPVFSLAGKIKPKR